MATVSEQIQKIYIGLLGRAADQEGLNYWSDEIEDGALTLEQLRANIVEEQPEYAAGLGQMSRAQAVNQLYENLFERSAEDEGLDYWVNGGGAEVNFDQLVLALVESASAADTLVLDNKAEVAQYYTNAAGDDYTEADARDAISDVDGSSESVTEAKDDVDNIGVESTTPLTTGQDTLEGTGGNDVFEAPIVQNQNGAVTNTLESGDVIDGGEGTDTLNADLTLTTSGSIPVGPAIAPTTNDVEVVNFRAQSVALDSGGRNVSNVDAGKMTGVEQWWSDNSRSDVVVEDVRSTPMEAAFGMRDTDPDMNFTAFINANHLDAGSEVGESAFNFTIRDPNALGNELQEISVIGIRFQLDGEDYELGGIDVESAATWGELQVALQDQINANDDLEGLTVEHSASGQFVVVDPEGGNFVIDPAGTVISSSTTTEEKAAAPGVPVVEDLQTETDIVLDGAGNGSQGGAMNVGVMSGDRGVEVFNVDVVNDSHLAPNLGSPSNAALASTNLRTGNEYLEEVYVEGEGSLSLGTKLPAGASTDDRLVNNGLQNVRVFDASGFEQELKVGASLDNNAIGRYLDDASEPVQFTYNLGDGGSNLSLSLTNTLTTDADFMLDINGGAEDDRINLSGNYSLAAVSIDGGEGRNTLETSSDIGVNPSSTPEAFENIQKLVLAGASDVDADMTDLAGVEELVVATDGSTPGADSTISNLEANTTISLSGKNQTLLNDSNDPQFIGTVNLVDAEATTQRVDLDNTARNSGVLTVADVLVTGTDSNVDELLLSSNGERNTTNVVQNIAAADASSVTFEGSQALSAHVSSLANNPNQALTVDGSALEDDLTLAVNANMLAEGTNDKVTGTDGDNDTLALYGALPQDATVSDFESVQLGWLAGSDLAGTFNTGNLPTGGTFDTANTTGVDTYTIGLLNSALELDNLSAGTNVVMGDDTPGLTSQQIGTFGQQITLSGSGSGAINVSSVDNLGSVNFGIGAHDLMIDGFADVNLEIARPNDATGTSNLYSGLQLDGLDAGGVGPLAGDALLFQADTAGNAAYLVDNVVSNLVITGADADQDDTLTLEDSIPASVDTIDVSGFEGSFTAELGNAVIEDPNNPGTYVSANSDVDFKLNSEHADITLTDIGTAGDAVDFNSVFSFTETPASTQSVNDAPSVTWTIDNFVAENLANSDANNYSKLDLGMLKDGNGDSIDAYGDLNVTAGNLYDADGTASNFGPGTDAQGNALTATDTVITAENGDNTWEIVLTGVTKADLDQNLNFDYA